MKKTITKIAALIFALTFTVFALVSCGAKNAAADSSYYEPESGEEYAKSYSSYGYNDADSYAGADDYETGEEAAQRSNVDGKASSPGLEIEDAAARKIIRNADLDVETKEFDEFIKETEKAIGQLKGYIESSEIYGNSYYTSSYRRAHITARIPAERLDEFIGIIGDAGNITSKSMTASDITAKYTDLQARIDSYEAERTALLALLEKAEKIDDIIQLREKLTEVNADLDSYKRQIKSYDSLVAYSTVKLDIEEVDRISTTNEKKGFFTELGERLSENLYNIGQGMRNFALWFISSLPYLLIFAAVITAVVLIIRKAVRKKRAKKQAKMKDTE